MTDPAPAPVDVPVPPDAVETGVGDRYWTVSGCHWAGAGLPDDVAALLAPPIVVGAAATPRRALEGTG
jgi:hypothetical protein